MNSDCEKFTYDSSIFFDDDELCGWDSSFLAEYFPDFNTFLTSATAKRIETLKRKAHTYIILNSGSHFDANHLSFIQYYLRHIVSIIQNEKWPKLIVETLPRTPSVILSDYRAKFRDAVGQYCQESGISFLDNFELSANLIPYDGKHFRLLFYLQKVLILLNFLKSETQTC